MDVKQELIDQEIKLTENELTIKENKARNTAYKALKNSFKYALQSDCYANSKDVLNGLSDGAVEQIAERLLQELVEGGRLTTLKEYKDQKGKTMLRMKMLENA